MKHRIVAPEKGVRALRAMHSLENELLALQKKVSRTRKFLPWVLVDGLYLFEANSGTKTLADLFVAHPQLITFHFKFQPFDAQGGLLSSLEADNFSDIQEHLCYMGIKLVLVSDASLGRINAYQERMNWHFDWVSTDGCSFNKDFLEKHQGSAEYYGLSVFTKDTEGYVYHTYSCQGAAMDMFNAALHLMDLTPSGRGEPREGDSLKRHDEYRGKAR